MKRLLSEAKAVVEDLSHPSPQLWLFKNRWHMSVLAVYFFSAAAVYIAGRKSHPVAAGLSVLGFLVYAVLDTLILNRFLLQKPSRTYQLWTLTGMIPPILVYFWMVRGTDPAGAAILWPLLAMPFYFLVRLYRYNSFIPKTAIPLMVVVLAAGAAPAMLAPGSDLNMNLAAAVWLLCLLVVIVIYVFSWEFYKSRFNAYQKIISWVGSDEARFESIQQNIEKLSSYLRLERLSILGVFRPDLDSPERNQEEEGADDPSHPEGAEGAQIRPPRYVRILFTTTPGVSAGEIKPWPLTKGLLARSYNRRKPENCRDTYFETCAKNYYRMKDVPAFEKTRSELVIPIIDGPKGQILGFVDLQSDRRRGILMEDEDYLGALAIAFSPLMVNQRLNEFLKSLDDLRRKLELTSSEDEVFTYIAPFARKHLDVDVVTYYKLGFGNGVPIPCPLQEGAWFPEYLNDRFHRRNPPPAVLVSRWKVLFEPDSRSNIHLLPSQTGEASGMDYFILREWIKSTAFLPVGTRQRRIGALFLNYRDRMEFSETDRLMLNTFLQTIIPYLEKMRRKQDTGEGFERDMFVLHETLSKTINTGSILDQGLLKLKVAYDNQDAKKVEETYDKLTNDLNQLLSEINSISLKTSQNLHNQLVNGLKDAFAAVAGQFAWRYQGSAFEYHIEPAELSENLPYTFRLAVLSIAIEEANNAFRYGRARCADILIKGMEGKILLEVKNNGSPWDWQQSSRDSQNGIFKRLELARKLMCAPEPQRLDDGRHLIVEFPILPTVEGRNPYA